MLHTEHSQILNTYLLHGAESFFEKLTGFQLVKKFPAFYGIRRFITAFTFARHLSLSRATIRFYGEELLAPRLTHKLEDHSLSAARDCLFNIFAATLHIGDRSSIRNLRTPHAMVTATHLSRNTKHYCTKFIQLGD